MYGKKKQGGLQRVFHITHWQNARGIYWELVTDDSKTDEKGLKGTGSQPAQEVACVKAANPPPPNRFFFPVSGG